jgi:hypothetical protein
MSFMRQPLTDVDYIRRVTLNVALVSAVYTARSAQIRLRIMLPLRVLSATLSVKALRFASMNPRQTRSLDGGLLASVHHHEKQYAPHFQEAQRNLY